MQRIVFMGTPDFAVASLNALIETQHVVGVVTQPDRPAGRGRQLRPSPVKVAALAAGLPVYQPESLRKEESAAPIRAWQPDLIVVAAYGQILRQHLLDLPPLGCLNVHASLLPRWRGASPIQHAILDGDAESGVCLMQMERGLDTGPVFVCDSLTLTSDETAATLHDKLAEMGGVLLRQHLDAIMAGSIVAVAQDDSASTYAPMIDKTDGAIDWSRSAVELDRRIRAMTPWPAAYTFWGEKRLKLGPMQLGEGDIPAGIAPGTVIQQGERIGVATGDGLLWLAQLQLAGKKAAAVADFVRGRPDFVGAQLGSAA